MLRHDLVYLHPEAAWDSPCAAVGSPLWLAAERWIAAGRPLVVARQPDDQALLLGLALPQAFNRQRLAILVAPAAIARRRPALAVADCLPRLPADQAAPLRELAGRAEICSAMLGVYGSLAWETLSGEVYRHAGSDIDLICDVATPAQFDTMLAALQRAEEKLNCKLDGEIRFPDGRAVAWREILARLKTPAAPVLVKGLREVDLQPLENLIATLFPEPCHV